MTTAPQSQVPAGALDPLKNNLYRALWIATVASNIGTWIHDVGASWLMISLSSSPFMVSLIQTATTLPLFLLALPAGVLADRVDRRKILLISQIWMFFAATLLAVCSWFNMVTAELLLIITFVLGVGTALNGPAWQAIITEIVPKPQLQPAIVLQGIGINVARALGPALGGFIIGLSGPYSAFFINALSFLGVITILFLWKREKQTESLLPVEQFWSAMHAGIRYVRFSTEFKIALIRGWGFVFFSCALWSLLPILAKHKLGLNASDLGLMMGAVGFGAIGGAFILPRLNTLLKADHQVVLSSMVFALSLVALSIFTNVGVLMSVLILTGLTWIVNLSKLNVAVQHALPDWVRARGLSIYLVVFFGSMAFGSLLWGSLATRFTIDTALQIAALGLILAQLLAFRFKLADIQGLELSPSMHWPAPTVAIPIEHDQGPILVRIQYQIADKNRKPFLEAIKLMQFDRFKTGAIRWELHEDIAQPGLFEEQFLVESWVEHLRQHNRVSLDEKKHQDEVIRYHEGATPPVVTHSLQVTGFKLHSDMTQPPQQALS